MKKDEAEKAIRLLCHEWVKERGTTAPTDQPTFSDFKSWMSNKGYGHYIDFRSIMGSDHDAEMWFDQEFNLTWRN